MSTINPMSHVGVTNIPLATQDGQTLATGQYSNPGGLGAYSATGNPISGNVTGIEKAGTSAPKPVSGPYSGPFMADAFGSLDPVVAAMPVFGPGVSVPGEFLPGSIALGS